MDSHSLRFKDDGIIPNNPNLPVLIYKHAFGKGNEIEEKFSNNNWRNSWEGGIFDYHHFHSNTHEVLGVMQGTATIMLGGEQGQSIEVKTGDVIILPAGTGHKCILASPDFMVLGAYPNGMNYNLKTGESENDSELILEIKQVPLPDADPVFGKNGPLLSEWLKE
ncbi:cupin domain-containing protein [Peribacillus psychrosaccharolyticus]|uniref:cupin domain-containing protein n=1 Tax=Peribacillus psychrosaccharolyticus TaxID=1407 RepID=UPI003D293A1A